MRKKLVSVFLAAALAVTTLTACSSQTGADTESKGAASEQEAQTKETKPERQLQKRGKKQIQMNPTK